MTTASPAVPHQPARVAARMAGMLAIMAGAIANSLDRPHRSPFDVVLWTAGLVLGLYACVLAANALMSRPLSRRGLWRLEGLSILIILAVAAWAAVAASQSSQWVASAASALVATGTGGMLWVVLWRARRHVRTAAS
jgi:hypothetical protein